MRTAGTARWPELRRDLLPLLLTFDNAILQEVKSRKMLLTWLVTGCLTVWGKILKIQKVKLAK
jgi:hypothetical protein